MYNMSSDLTGGIKNALERKESLESIRQSFLNAGYPLNEVDSAIREVSGVPIQMTNPGIQNTPQPTLPTQGLQAPPSPQSQFQTLPQTPQITTNKSNALLYIIVGVLCLLILVGSAILGIFWDKFFP